MARKNSKNNIKIKPATKKASIRNRSLIVFCTLLLLVGIVMLGENTNKYNMAVGDISTNTIVAPRDVENTVATESAKQLAASRVTEEYVIDESITELIQEEITDIFTDIRYVRLEDLTTEEKVQKLNTEIPFTMTFESYSTAISMTNTGFNTLEYDIQQVIAPILEAGYKEQDVTSGKIDSEVEEGIAPLKYPQNERTLGKDIALGIMSQMANLVVDEVATDGKKLLAMEEVEPVIVQKNMIIVAQGQVVTEEHLSMLQSLDLLATDGAYQYTLIIAKIIIILATYAIAALYLFFFKAAIFNSQKMVLLINLLTLITVAVGNILFSIEPYIMAVILITAAMLIGILINTSMSFVLTVFIVIIMALTTSANNYMIIFALLSSFVGVLAASRTKQRSKMTRIGIILSLFCAGLAFLSEWVQGIVVVEAMTSALWAGVGGMISAILVIGILPFLENGFHITTSFKLLELSNPNQPLLKRLMLEAPGTYHHSILVANMAEAAADAIEGNGLLARVGAYYHDIGKIKRPGHFVENQLGGVNPHNKYTPSLSTLIISSHVKDGYEMAKEANLPDEICNIIKEHHGDTLLAYFFNKAKEQEPDKEIDEKAFRYEGPKPGSKEGAIILLADSVEAATRAMAEPTKGKIDGLVRKIIRAKLEDDQLDRSDLTLKDLDIIANVFSKMLEGVYHARIEYPDIKPPKSS